jgi:hypothetical protein
MNFIPKWIYEIACANTALIFLSTQSRIEDVAEAHVQSLKTFYREIPAEELVGVAEELLRFLDELNAGDTATELLTGFCFNTVKYESANKPRKLKGLFGSADEPVKLKENIPDVAVKKFKAYIYSLRNGVAVIQPHGWKLSHVEESAVIKEIAELDVNPLDFL